MKNIVKKIQAKKSIQILLKFSGHIEDCALSIHSGHTAFFFMLSFFPFMLFLFAILRLTPLTEEFFSNFLPNFIPVSFHNFIGNLIHDIYAASNVQLLSLSIISAIWLGSKSFLSLIQGLNSMYRQQESRNFIMLRIFAFLYSILFALLLIATLGFLVFGNWIYTHIIQSLPYADWFLCTLLHISDYVLRPAKLQMEDPLPYPRCPSGLNGLAAFLLALLLLCRLF